MSNTVTQIKCQYCPVLMHVSWKQAKWCPGCKIWCCSHCRGGTSKNVCPQCKRMSLKMSQEGH